MEAIKYGKKYEVWHNGKKKIMYCKEDPDEYVVLLVEGEPTKDDPPLLIKEIEQ